MLTAAAVTLEGKKVLLVAVFRRAMPADFGELRHAENPRSLDAKMHKTPSQLYFARSLVILLYN